MKSLKLLAHSYQYRYEIKGNIGKRQKNKYLVPIRLNFRIYALYLMNLFYINSLGILQCPVFVQKKQKACLLLDIMCQLVAFDNIQLLMS